MKIQEQDLYHGAALTQIVEHLSFKALNRASIKYGHYLVNADRQVFVKYRKSKTSPWIFTLQPAEVQAIASAIAAPHKVFLCLVCGNMTVCALTVADIQTVIDTKSKSQQWVRVEVPKSGSCHVSGTSGKMKKTVPHKSFPDNVFA